MGSFVDSNAEAQARLRQMVSRETYERLNIFAELLVKWQKMINLVAPSTMNQIWHRHIYDSAQVYLLKPDVTRWLDIGSGGGFPGLVTAIFLSETSNAKVTLIESDKRKCAFLREVSREAGLPVDILVGRIEDRISEVREQIEMVSARALAPISKLIEYCDDMLLKGAHAVFLKGKDVQRELTEVPLLDRYSYRIIPSQTDIDGCLVEIFRAG